MIVIMMVVAMMLALGVLMFMVVMIAFAMLCSMRLRMIIVMIVILLGLVSFLLGNQCETVGNRDLVIVGMDFGKGQEAMPVAAIFHEGSL